MKIYLFSYLRARFMSSKENLAWSTTSYIKIYSTCNITAN